MSERPETVEDAAAGILNGTMISLLGGGLPAIFIWQVVIPLGRGDLDLRLVALSDAAPFLGGMFLSLICLRAGIRLLWRNLKYFRRGLAPSPPE